MLFVRKYWLKEYTLTNDMIQEHLAKIIRLYEDHGAKLRMKCQSGRLGAFTSKSNLKLMLSVFAMEYC